MRLTSISFRTAYYVTKHVESSCQFVIMGDGASQEKYDELRRLGIHSITDLNKYLDRPLTPLMLAYCLCMGRILSPLGGGPQEKLKRKAQLL